MKDFSYIAMVASTPLMLVVHPSTPAASVRELIQLLKANPGKYTYGSSGNGTIVHLAAEMLKSGAGVDALHVPYKGSNPATAAILGGEVAFVFSTMPPALANARAGKLRALAVTTAKRVAPAPEIPTMIEAGLRDFEIVLYSGILGPKGMDRALVGRINAELAKVVRAPEIRNVYEKIGADPLAMSPAEFEKRTAAEIAKLGPVVKASGAKVD
jgi:tripartite-type tricarboxylate transporter receptor subunit TctC